MQSTASFWPLSDGLNMARAQFGKAKLKRRRRHDGRYQSGCRRRNRGRLASEASIACVPAAHVAADGGPAQPTASPPERPPSRDGGCVDGAMSGRHDDAPPGLELPDHPARPHGGDAARLADARDRHQAPCVTTVRPTWTGRLTASHQARHGIAALTGGRLAPGRRSTRPAGLPRRSVRIDY